jgi:phosphotransferase system enzyme I (PtsP)
LNVPNEAKLPAASLLLRLQLRALISASRGRELRVMFPLVASVEEFRAARALLLAEAKRLQPSPGNLRIGTMIEVPALMWQLPALLKEVDFVSVGSNDLLQFLFAADRGTPSLYDRYDFLSQPMLDILEQLARASAATGVPVSLCGEAAGHRLEALTIAALGIRTLSMPASGILPIKAMFSQVDLDAFQSVLASIRRGGGMDLREPIATWAREHGVLT